MRTSLRGVKLIAHFEGVFLRPYNDPVGFSTVGIGHLIARRNVNAADRSARWLRRQAKPGQLTQLEAYQLLQQDLSKEYESYVNALRLPLSQNQFDALVSFVYNLGPGSIGTDTGTGRALRQRNWREAADQMLRWDKAGGRALLGLTRRRQAERRLFLKK